MFCISKLHCLHKQHLCQNHEFHNAALVIAAFGLVAALAWNDAIKTIFKEVFGEESTIGPMLLYAIIVTIIAVILTIIVARAVANAKNK
ncbi:MAG: DUF5654 family protein [Nitrosopumilus sp.]|nr:DUF5654 family protein [Nitrosopumilus sp.]